MITLPAPGSELQKDRINPWSQLDEVQRFGFDPRSQRLTLMVYEFLHFVVICMVNVRSLYIYIYLHIHIPYIECLEIC